MKKITLLTGLIASFFFVQAQDYAAVSAEKFTFASGEKDALKISFEKVEAKQVEAALKAYMKNYKVKPSSVKGADGEYEVEEFVITDIKQTPTSLSVKVSELEGHATLYMAYKLEGGVINPTSALYKEYSRFTENIAKKAVTIAYDDKIAGEMEVLSQKDKELSGLAKDEEKQKEGIEKSKTTISQCTSAIATFQSSLDRQKMTVADKQKLVSNKETEMAGMDVKVQEKQIKDLHSENGKIGKEISKEHETVAKINGDIALMNSEMSVLDKTISAQKEVLAATADKKQLKEVKALETDKSKKLGEVEKLKGDIRIAESAIKTKKDAIELNKSKIGQLKADMASHNEDALKEQLKLLEKDAKDAANEQKNIEKSIEKETNAITKENEKIRAAETEISNLKTKQDSKKLEIEGVSKAIDQLKDLQSTFN